MLTTLKDWKTIGRVAIILSISMTVFIIDIV